MTAPLPNRASRAARAFRSNWIVGVLSLVLGMWLAPVSLARAHPDLDAGLRAADAAEFEVALAAYDRALASGSLTRDELCALLASRALVQHGLGNGEAARADLSLLVSIKPDFDVGESASPAFQATVEEVRASAGDPVSIELDADTVPGGVRVRAVTPTLPSNLSVRLSVAATDSPWQSTQGDELRYPAEVGTEIRYYGEIVGPGRVVVARVGSEESPIVRVLGDEDEAASSLGATGSSADEPKSRRALYVWLGAGGAVLVAAAVGLAIAFSGDDESGRTEVNRPVVEF